MPDRLAHIEERLAAIEWRLALLEEEASLSEPGEGTPSAAQAQPGRPRSRGDLLPNTATLLGRVLLVFGGAYLLRAVTDFGFLPTVAGIPVGIAYALIWLFLAWRHGAQDGRRTVAATYGCVSVLLVLPILVEAVTRFELMGGATAAAAVTVYCLLVLGVAATRNLRSVALLAVAGGIATGLLLMRVTGAAVSFSFELLVLGLVSFWLVYLRGWTMLHWLGAIGADLGLALLGFQAFQHQWGATLAAAFAFAMVLWLGYLLSFAIRTHVLGRSARVFEAVQTVFASTIALAITLRASETEPAYLAVLGFAALASGLGAYALAFSPQTRSRRGPNYYYYSTLGLVLLVGGSAVLAPGGVAASGWAILAALMAWLSGRSDRVTLSLQSTLLLVAAGIGSAALEGTWHALTGDPVEGWQALTLPQVLVAAATVFCLFVPVAQRSERWGGLAGFPQLVVLLLSVWVVGGQIVTVLAPIVAGVPGGDSDLGRLAALRTAVLASAAVTLALSSRFRRWPEARWLAYPVLVAVGIKLVMDDFPNGRPVTLFVALALVGGALILVARLLPKRA